ncbi:hypothetical protein J6590_007468 [Homalodisca vitripennis]|nr:hypothetical protein J6590_007468 [Homalodisca vitripennis]
MRSNVSQDWGIIDIVTKTCTPSVSVLKQSGRPPSFIGLWSYCGTFYSSDERTAVKRGLTVFAGP